MKNSLNFSKSNSKTLDLALYFTQIDDLKKTIIKQVLKKTYSDVIDVYEKKEIDLPKQAYNIYRNQYDVNILLGYLLKIKKSEIAFWVINKDIYCKGMNFVFGYASYYKGAILSIFRLYNQNLIEKEAIHEVGHILGLNHCRNQCVMQFSNSLSEALEKPSFLCESCKRKIMSI